MRLFRITQQLDRAAAFDGVGASLYPGRWNERTRRVIYTTSRISLGILGVIAQSSGAPLVGYVAYPLDVPNEALAVFDRSVLSRTWRSADAGRAECRVHGERWRDAGSTAGLIVPSAVLPEAYDSGEFNVVLNPLHTDFARATFEDAIPLDVDVRLQPVVSPLPSQRRRRRGAKVM